MKKLFSLLPLLILMQFANAQTPFGVQNGIRVPKVYVETKMSIGIDYASTPSTTSLHIKGLTAGASEYALFLENSTGDDIFDITNDGRMHLMPIGGEDYDFTGSTLSFVNGGIIRNQKIQGATLTWGYIHHTTENVTVAPSSGGSYFQSNVNLSDIGGTVAGSGTIMVFDNNPTINLAVTSNGATVIGYRYKPTITLYGGTKHYAMVLESGRFGLGLADPTSTFHMTGSTALTPVAVTVSNTATEAQTYIRANATGGAIVETLPAAANCIGRLYIIIKTDVSANAVTADGNAAETINGAATFVLADQYDAVSIISNGVSWDILWTHGI